MQYCVVDENWEALCNPICNCEVLLQLDYSFNQFWCHYLLSGV